ncbi:hypothetical protein [uncultured Microscilla sp.]|uniref:hypothetical protein n=1 Tax=uncultured Microscilla sp. TaxID=432653 RepID=UPI002603EE76|nr:hypothetical protein [uncultured Microscilla sp.]
MGVDIHIKTEPDIFEADFEQSNHKYRLSRQFCWLITDMKAGTNSELFQLGDFTNTDIHPLIKMCDYPPEVPPDRYRFLYGKPNESDEEVLARVNQMKQASQQSLDTIELLVHKLLLGLVHQANFFEKVVYSNQNKYWLKSYFKGVENDAPSQNFMDNNLGRDLRNFLNTLEYIRSKKGEQVFFRFL